MPTRGRPSVLVRLHPEALRRLRQKVKVDRGRKSGVAGYIREVLYAHLGFDSGEWEATSKEADGPS